ncbi:F-box/WD repeat-containing protein 7 [Astathelohania contejeani]|uniref:F-box/WD repeat-containing protein 7 n=1 Tax=Astathelohania contejeani TaxID=164912 RepID=A0ABQ7HZJ3_9MICR|nr:F-box/WD repeat-containing protein 7 [Thelohania contejeani]
MLNSSHFSKRKKQHTHQINIVNSLPSEIHHQIFSHLNFRDLQTLSYLDKKWKRSIGANFLLWKSKFEELDLDNTKLENIKGDITTNDYKYAIKRYYQIRRNWIEGDQRILVDTNQKDITQIIINNGFIFVSSDDHSIKIYTQDGKAFKTLSGHAAGVWTFAVRNNILVSGSIDRTIRIWNFISGLTLKILQGHLSTIRCIKVVENYIISGSRDSNIRIWDMDGRCLYVLRGHMGSVRCLDVFNMLLLSGSYDGTVILWCIKTGKMIRQMPSHLKRVYSVKLTDSYAISGAEDGIVSVSNLEGQLLYELNGNRSIVAWLNLIKTKNKEKYLLTAGADGIICKWNLENGSLIYKIVEDSRITTLSVINGFIVLGTHTSVKLYSLFSGKLIRNLISSVDGVLKVDCTSSMAVIGYKNKGVTKICIVSFNGK